MGKPRGESIRNSTADFLMFAFDGQGEGIQVVVEDEMVWLTQKAMATLFDCTVGNINKHLKSVFESGELEEAAVIEDFSITAADGKNYTTKHYNLDAVISVGYRINSMRATQFRKWATGVLSAFTRRGYVLDRRRLENGQVFSTEYFDRQELPERRRAAQPERDRVDVPRLCHAPGTASHSHDHGGLGEETRRLPTVQ